MGAWEGDGGSQESNVCDCGEESSPVPAGETVPAGAGGPGSWGEEEGGAETGGREEKAGSGLPFGQPK